MLAEHFRVTAVLHLNALQIHLLTLHLFFKTEFQEQQFLHSYIQVQRGTIPLGFPWNLEITVVSATVIDTIF